MTLKCNCHNLKKSINSFNFCPLHTPPNPFLEKKSRDTSCVVPRTDEVIHDLKIWPRQFEAVVGGQKTHEVRKNDRCFIAGDLINLREYNPDTGIYTGSTCLVLITYVTPAGSFGLPDDLCVLSIKIEKWAMPNADSLND